MYLFNYLFIVTRFYEQGIECKSLCNDDSPFEFGCMPGFKFSIKTEVPNAIVMHSVRHWQVLTRRGLPSGFKKKKTLALKNNMLYNPESRKFENLCSEINFALASYIPI